MRLSRGKMKKREKEDYVLWIIGKTITQSVPAMLRKINMIMLLQKIIDDEWIMKNSLSASVSHVLSHALMIYHCLKLFFSSGAELADRSLCLAFLLH